jgi:hypothetical protein
MSANEKIWVDWSGESTSPLIDESLRAGLALLWRAFICARDTGASLWDFALRTGRLYEAGTTSSDLRWMVAKGFAEHGQETSGYDDTHRSFRRSNGYFFNDQTCLILTPSGAALAEHVLGETARRPQAALSALAAVAGKTAAVANAAANPTLKPRWSATRRELSLEGLVVKRFRVPARNQETILSVFEEEGWAEHIHDPLPVTHDIDAPTRLHDAINRLNRCQINPLLRFHGDGKGTGVFWELRQPKPLG